MAAGQSSTPQIPVEAHPVPNGPQDLQLLLLVSLRPTGMRKCSCTELVLQSLGERWRRSHPNLTSISPASSAGRTPHELGPALAAKSSANPDCCEGLGSLREEPPGKVHAIPGQPSAAP